ncbi:MAG: hypothetical protein KF709_13640 [Gemmatimonadaceae bacterium]|nr:hypothetical protein [Gemmatimonadaceae bacterium]
MIAWLVALLVGASLALLTYRGVQPRGVAALRALAAVAVTALLLDAPLAPARPLAPWVVVDASASWGTDGSGAAWSVARRVVDSLQAAGADSLLLFGDSLRGDSLPVQPRDRSSRVEPVVAAARALGRPVVVVTDGRLTDTEHLADLPRGSRLLRVDPTELSDLAVAGLNAPRAAVIGDTLDLRIILRSGALATQARRVGVRLGGRDLGGAQVPALEAYAEREEHLRVVVPALEGEQDLVVSIEPNDALAANDSLRVPINVVGTARIALVSTAPDQDARFALTVLRGTQRAAVRAYWRVAPGQWREGDALRAVPEATVRRAVEQASLAVLHGDTAYFGAPRSRSRGALVLMPTPPAGPDEHYVVAAGDSPLRPLLGDLPWDALPPLTVGAPVAADGTLGALLARRARRTDERAVVALREGPPRVVVLTAAGFWRWRTRGGRPADAFDALWGTIFDWATATPRVAGSAAGSASVNAELVPQPATVQSGSVGEGPARDLAPRARGAWWLALLALVALCTEWVLRRRIGWR